MEDNIRFSAQGLPHWFSPRHAGEKFKEICIELAILAQEAEAAKKKTLGKKLWKGSQQGRS